MLIGSLKERVITSFGRVIISYLSQHYMEVENWTCQLLSIARLDQRGPGIQLSACKPQDGDHKVGFSTIHCQASNILREVHCATKVRDLQFYLNFSLTFPQRVYLYPVSN